MSDIDSDAENRSLSMKEIDSDNQSDCSTSARQRYRPHQL